MSKTMTYEVDLANLPPLTTAQKAELNTLAALPYSKIDHSDIPPLTDDFWKAAAKKSFYKPTKEATTVRVDSDVLLVARGAG